MNLGKENEHQEFKLGLGQLDKGLKSLSAMLNRNAQGSDIPYSCDGRYYLRTAAADEQISSALLRKMLVSGNMDMLMEVSSEEQELTRMR